MRLSHHPRNARGLLYPSVYWEGVFAAKLGMGKEANPYGEMSARYDEWLYGWAQEFHGYAYQEIRREETGNGLGNFERKAG